MKGWKIFIATAAVFLVLAALVLSLHTGVTRAEEGAGTLLAAAPVDKGGEEDIESETDFWTIFRGLFSSAEPEYADETTHTEVAGVRGIEREGKMDEEAYDFDSVRWMEEYNLNPDSVKSFLKQGKLGPYQENSGEKGS